MAGLGNYEFHLGIAAISWVNDDIPGLGDHYSLDHILGEMREIGYEATEMGRTFPRNLEELKAILEKHDITLASKFVGTQFSNLQHKDQEVRDFEEWVRFLKDMDCEYVIVCEMGNSMHWDKDDPDKARITAPSEAQWKSMVDGLNEAGRIAKKYGLELVYHPHAGTIVEQREDVDRLMAETDEDAVSLLYDTGHAFFGNYDPMDQLTRYYDRIKYVHYKDVREDIWNKTIKENLTFREAVLEGLFTVPGDGCIDFEPVLEELMKRGYQGWTVVEAEQDPDVAPPYKYAKMAKDHLDETMEKVLEKYGEKAGR